MRLNDKGTNKPTSRTAPTLSVRRRAIGLIALAVSVVSTFSWLAWRLVSLGPHPVELGVFMVEVAGLATGVGVAIALATTRSSRSVFENDPRESSRYAFAVADLVGRTRAVDLHREVRDAMRAAPRWRPRNLGDVAVASVLADGPRRLGFIIVLNAGLLLGVAPFPMPPSWALASAALGVVAMSLAHVVLSAGRIRVGDRTRWSIASLGEVFSAADRDDLAPRRWVGTVAVVVVTNLAVALRGMSDRWTHGLPPMSSDDRLVGMALATALIVAALYTLRTMPAPQLPNAHLVSRRLEERTARQSAVGGAVCVGLIGLLAGVLPGGVDAADRDPVRIERVSDDRVESVVPHSLPDGGDGDVGG